jgi:hypothetical protein
MAARYRLAGQTAKTEAHGLFLWAIANLTCFTLFESVGNRHHHLNYEDVVRYIDLASDALTAPSSNRISSDGLDLALNAIKSLADHGTYSASVAEPGIQALQAVHDAQGLVPLSDCADLLLEAYDYGQFADDFDRPLAKPMFMAQRTKSGCGELLTGKLVLITPISPSGVTHLTNPTCGAAPAQP